MPLFDFPSYEPESQVLSVFSDPALLPARGEDANEMQALKKQLSRCSASSLDVFVNAAATHVSSQIDCTRCANCCKTLEPDLTENEIHTLARVTGLNETAFVDRYTKQDVRTNHRYLAATPCVFLKNNLCNVYASRPTSCSTFPHLNEPNVKFRLTRVFELRHVCPIVYHTVEVLLQAAMR